MSSFRAERDLYEPCEICNGTGRIDSTRPDFESLVKLNRPAVPGNLYRCPYCQARGFQKLRAWGDRTLARYECGLEEGQVTIAIPLPLSETSVEFLEGYFGMVIKALKGRAEPDPPTIVEPVDEATSIPESLE